MAYIADLGASPSGGGVAVRNPARITWNRHL